MCSEVGFITGVAIMPLTVLSILVWKNLNVKKLKQERETQKKEHGALSI